MTTQAHDDTVKRTRNGQSYFSDWSDVGWDLETDTTAAWLADIELQFDNQPQLAIDKLHRKLIWLLELDLTSPPADLENGPSEKDFAPWQERQDDIEWYVIELARLMAIRDRLFKVDLAK